MPTFEIEQFETYVRTYKLEADSKAKALKKLLCGEIEQSGPMKYHSINLELGMSIEKLGEKLYYEFLGKISYFFADG